MRTDSALAVLSGGQDSTTCLFWAKQRYGVIHAITFDYQQRHIAEIDAARKVAKMAGVASHEVLALPNCLVSTSPLVDPRIELEKYKSFDEMDLTIGNRVELTFVPMRNTLFLTIAMNRAVALRCGAVVTGVCQQDNANYPDCTREFVSKFCDAANESLGFNKTYAEPNRIDIVTPLVFKTKAESVHIAMGLPGCMEALAHSHTSYDGKYPPTDMNHSNILRAKGFQDAGVADPLVLRAYHEGLMDLPDTPNYTEYRRTDTPVL